MLDGCLDHLRQTVESDEAPKAGAVPQGAARRKAESEAPKLPEEAYELWYKVRLDPAISPAPAGWVYGKQVELAVPGDIIFCAAYGVQQGKIERRGHSSWSVVTYQSDVGPFSGSSAQTVNLTLSGETSGMGLDLVARFFGSRRFWLLPAGLVLAGGLLVLGSFLDLLRRGETYEHWSRYVVMIFCFSTAALLMATRGIDYMLGLVGERMSYWVSLRSVRKDEAAVGLER